MDHGAAKRGYQRDDVFLHPQIAGVIAIADENAHVPQRFYNGGSSEPASQSGGAAGILEVFQNVAMSDRRYNLSLLELVATSAGTRRIQNKFRGIPNTGKGTRMDTDTRNTELRKE